VLEPRLGSLTTARGLRLDRCAFRWIVDGKLRRLLGEIDSVTRSGSIEATWSALT
jgi:hypothetical protein